MTGTIHKLTAGTGYDYLTRQVAAQDATERGHTGLASYYTERGETPGRWLGSGVTGLGGLAVGDPVTEQQMQALFGAGLHPLTEQIRERLEGPGIGERERDAATRLGRSYPVYSDVSGFRREVARRFANANAAAGVPRDWPLAVAERARIRTDVARELFRAEYGRDPAGARELAATIARHSRQQSTAVAGYDLTFSPVKSVSTLWAVANPATAAKIETAHNAAVADALAFIERHALFTRTGTNGVRQVDVRGLVATAFTHRDSRAGDPDLHTHVAVANKVQTLDGRWLSVDGRVLFTAMVAASETYNTALEQHLAAGLGVRFEQRPEPGRGGRPVREVVGVDDGLNRFWSARRADIETRRGVLAQAFQAAHGRPPSPVEAVKLAQQATLETRPDKHEPRTLAEQRTAWRAQAEQVLGGPDRVEQMVRRALSPSRREPVAVDAGWVAAAADRVTAVMEEHRSTWQVWHVRAEALRQIRGAADATGCNATEPGPFMDQVVDQVVGEVLDRRCLPLRRPDNAPHTLDPVVEPVEGVDRPVEPGEPVEPVEPPELRRADGQSVYRVAGADLFTSSRILGAERRLVDAAGRRGGFRVPDAAVEVALLESTANGVTLNAGQVGVVRAMATSGARVQLAIAPAGAGKTTAMRALAAAWTGAGGTVVGLAPSAAAASVLRTQIGSTSDTIASLSWPLTNLTGGSEGAAGSVVSGLLPDWAGSIDERTLVVIDEAGMADTISLDAAVGFVLDRGGSVRLIGDDQQLSAIGAGGVLRDIRATHGATHLSELLRFADPAEAAASLALRDGRPEALGFYLDTGRVHVGDPTTATASLFDAWRTDRDAGLDTLMLAPTRDAVAALNRQARHHRLATDNPPDPAPENTAPDGTAGHTTAAPVRTLRTVRLADGNEASVGDLLITRQNNRLLRFSSHDWVKNGDRWTLTGLPDDGSLTVRHQGTGRTVRLPEDYVRQWVELGYASTIHGAQGVTADTVHGLATGTESRQQLYTMLTRGRLANHVHLQVVGDGDPHTLIRPEVLHPATATDLLEAILARDDAAVSVTSLQRQLADPATRLGDATARYVDALYVAAEATIGPHTANDIDATAERVAPGISEEPAWPALRAHLILLAATGDHPTQRLVDAATTAELATARDRAAVLSWRLDDTGLRNAGPGPLPWIPAIPPALRDDPHWGSYLTARSDLVTDLAAHVRHPTSNDAGQRDQQRDQRWRQAIHSPKATVALPAVRVWRAAMQVPDSDQRPLGPRLQQKAAALYQRRLLTAITAGQPPALAEWGPALHAAGIPSDDPYAPVLAERLAAISRAGINALDHLTAASPASPAQPLPDDHAAAALWWRISRHLTAPVLATAAATIAETTPLHTRWTDHLEATADPATVDRLQGSPYWPALVASVDHALARGWTVPNLTALTLTHSHPDDPDDADDPALAATWRIRVLLDPVARHADPDQHEERPEPEHPDDDAPPDDLWDGVDPDTRTGPRIDGTDPTDPTNPTLSQRHVAPAAPAAPADRPEDDAYTTELGQDLDQDLEQELEQDLAAQLAMAIIAREVAGPAEPTDADIDRMLDRAAAWDTSPVTRDRMLQVNQLAVTYFARRLPGSWSQQYLTDRLGTDVLTDPRYQPGHAPNSWTGLVDALRSAGVTDTELLTTDLARRSSRGTLIDRFRDRTVLPILHRGDVIGFVARRRPDLDGDSYGDDHGDHQAAHHAGPKYLNTADTPLFHKGAQLYGADALSPGQIPVLVEGPLDAIAVTLAGDGVYVGVAPLGTALTRDQAAALGRTGPRVIVARDGDLAGRVAAERDYWLLTAHRLDPRDAPIPAGSDPADIYTRHGARALVRILENAPPLAHTLIRERLDNLPKPQARQDAVAIIAARPGTTWADDTAAVATHLGEPLLRLHHQVITAAHLWTYQPDAASQSGLDLVAHTRQRLLATKFFDADAHPGQRLEAHPQRAVQRKRDHPAAAPAAPARRTPSR